MKFTKLMFLYIVLILILNTNFVLNAQKINIKKYDQETLKKYPLFNYDKAVEESDRIYNNYQTKKIKVENYASRNKIPIVRKFEDGTIRILTNIENGIPVYNGPFSLNAAKTISTNKLWDGSGYGFDLTGEYITLGLWDFGSVETNHIEFQNSNIIVKDPNPIIYIYPHTTWMAGIIMAAGIGFTPGPIDAAKGMAKNVELHNYTSKDDIYEISTSDLTMRASNHSYGNYCGWDIVGDTAWWYGDITLSNNEDYKFGYYSEKTSEIDNITHFIKPYHLIVAAAGNDRGEFYQGYHYYLNIDSAWVWGDVPRDKDGGSDQFDCIAAPLATAKNVLTVGAVLDIENGYNNPSDVTMTEFSGWGPTDDGRIKPDIVANGYEIITPDYIVAVYDTGSGTSGATASVTGSCALILEHYEDLFPGRDAMLASTLKALIIHTADEAGNPGPDYKFGWGLMNTKSAVELISIEFSGGEGTHIAEHVLTPGSILDFEIQPTGQDSLILTLCWSDPAGPYPLNPVLNPTTKRLVNDLDLVLTDPNNNDHFTYRLNPSSPDDIATYGDNNIDNVEKIIVEYPLSGNYIAHISHDGNLQGEQYFSLILSGGKFTEPDTSTVPPPPPPNTYKVSVDQKLSDNSTSIGSVRAWSYLLGFWNGPYSVPIDFYKQIYPLQPSYLSLKATNNIYSNEKFIKWTSTIGSTGFIWERFEFTQDISVKSNLQPIHNAIIKNEISPGINNGIIYFKDPWYIDFTDSSYYYVDNTPNTLSEPCGFRNKGNNPLLEQHDSPFNITIDPPRKGIFLNISGPSTNWYKPYYSVRAEDEVVFQLRDEYVTGYFKNWEAEPSSSAEFQSANNLETAVVFRQDGAEVKALYKGHLVSANSVATGLNNSRKIDVDDESNLYMVYEDAGEIYCTSSSNNGTSWSAEIKISSGSGGCANPALTVVTWGNDVLIYVVWAEYNGNRWQIQYRRKNASGIWDATQTIDIWCHGIMEPVPAITHLAMVNYPNIYVFYHSRQFLDYFINPKPYPEISGWRKNDNYIGTSSWNKIFAMTNGLNPSLSQGHSGGNGYIGIAWEKNDKIYFQQTDYYSNWSDTYEISEDLWYLSDHEKPSISQGFHGYHIVWQAFDEMAIEGTVCLYRIIEIGSGELSELTQLPSGGDLTFNPSVSANYSDEYTIFYGIDQGEDKIRKVTYIDEKYEDKIIGTGRYPNAVDHAMNSAVYTKYNSAPYFIEHYYYDDGGEEEELIEMKRFDFVFDSTENGGQKGYLTLDLIQLSVEENDLELEEGLFSDSVALQNSTFSLQYALIVCAHQISPALNKTNPLLNFRFNDGTTSYSLNSLKLNDILNPDGTAKNHSSSHLVTVFNLPANLGKIEVMFNDKEPIVTKILMDDAGYSNYLAKGGINDCIFFTPEEYNLWQNYPNPFNPVTTIQFDLPEAGKTKLEVFDIRGRLVITLVNDNLNSGRYTYLFDGSNLSSGLYFYVINSKPSNGSKKLFREVKKMMLVK